MKIVDLTNLSKLFHLFKLKSLFLSQKKSHAPNLKLIIIQKLKIHELYPYHYQQK